MIPDYTIVCGVDQKHLRQLSWVWPTWRKHKPSLLEHPMVVFYDKTQLTAAQIQTYIDHPHLWCFPWPFDGISYEGIGDSKWSNPQRYKMLAGFVHVPPLTVRTPYWLKIDTDVVAIGVDDWIDPKWFEGVPSIISHKWSFTKPGDQMMLLDRWVEKWGLLKNTFALNMEPKPGSARLSHPRIISRVGFFQTKFTSMCSDIASKCCGIHQLPVPSQDGYMWYMAKRLGHEIKRVHLKDQRGWQHWSTEGNIFKHAVKAMDLEGS